METEYVNRFLKEVFPFKFTIVNHMQGDVKQILPSGLEIYYDCKTNAVEYKTANKKVYYFMNRNQVDMYRKTNEGDYQEAYTQGKCIIKQPNGT